MIKNREAVYSAIYDIVLALKAAGKIVDCSRKEIHWADLSASQQPFVCQMQMPESVDYKLGSGIPSRDTGEVDLVVYVQTDEASDVSPAQALNEVVQVLVDAFKSPRSGERFTLGGLVHDCAVSGSIELDEGNLGTQAVAVVPVKFLI